MLAPLTPYQKRVIEQTARAEKERSRLALARGIINGLTIVGWAVLMLLFFLAVYKDIPS